MPKSIEKTNNIGEKREEEQPKVDFEDDFAALEERNRQIQEEAEQKRRVEEEKKKKAEEEKVKAKEEKKQKRVERMTERSEELAGEVEVLESQKQSKQEEIGTKEAEIQLMREQIEKNTEQVREVEERLGALQEGGIDMKDERVKEILKSIEAKKAQLEKESNGLSKEILQNKEEIAVLQGEMEKLDKDIEGRRQVHERIASKEPVTEKLQERAEKRRIEEASREARERADDEIIPEMDNLYKAIEGLVEKEGRTKELIDFSEKRLAEDKGRAERTIQTICSNFKCKEKLTNDLLSDLSTSLTLEELQENLEKRRDSLGIFEKRKASQVIGHLLKLEEIEKWNNSIKTLDQFKEDLSQVTKQGIPALALKYKTAILDAWELSDEVGEKVAQLPYYVSGRLGQSIEQRREVAGQSKSSKIGSTLGRGTEEKWIEREREQCDRMSEIFSQIKKQAGGDELLFKHPEEPLEEESEKAE